MTHADNLLAAKPGEAVLSEPVPPTVLASTDEGSAKILLDFGVEVQGYVELITPLTPDQQTPRRVRIRFGESVAYPKHSLRLSWHDTCWQFSALGDSELRMTKPVAVQRVVVDWHRMTSADCHPHSGGAAAYPMARVHRR